MTECRDMTESQKTTVIRRIQIQQKRAAYKKAGVNFLLLSYSGLAVESVLADRTGDRDFAFPLRNTQCVLAVRAVKIAVRLDVVQLVVLQLTPLFDRIPEF